jgi:ubiquinone/menaquinone biosynthesis C-methylase UbiE
MSPGQQTMGFIVNTCIEVYKRLKRRFTPQLRHSQYAYKETLEAYIHPRVRWLDAGCGHGIFPDLMKERGGSLVARSGFVVGMDCDCPSLWANRVVHSLVAGDLSAMPFRDSSFDLVSANMVVEHLSETDSFGQALYRVLKPGGVFIFHTPNYLHYQTVLSSLMPQRHKNKLIKWLEGRDENDVFPTRYRWNTAKAIHKLAERNGFAVKELKLVNSNPETFRLGPVVLLEFFLIWLTEWPPLRALRSNLVVVLEKRAAAVAPPLKRADVQAGRPSA